MKTLGPLVLLVAFALLIGEAKAGLAQSASIPPSSTDKAASTPDFYQEDPRGGFAKNGDMYCAPVSVSDGFFYLADHGFGGLVGSSTGPADKAQIDMIQELATDRYLRTRSEGGTNADNFLLGVRAYVQNHDYTCQRLEFAGPAKLSSSVASCKIGNQPSMDWIKGGVADPNGFVWLILGKYKRGDEPGQWVQDRAHFVAVVGYGPGNTLYVHNPNRENYLPPATSVQDDEITLMPLNSGQLVLPQFHRTLDATGYYLAAGPGLPLPPGIDTYIVQGAVLLVMGRQSP